MKGLMYTAKSGTPRNMRLHQVVLPILVRVFVPFCQFRVPISNIMVFVCLTGWLGLVAVLFLDLLFVTICDGLKLVFREWTIMFLAC